jgi:hypothetical protein
MKLTFEFIAVYTRYTGFDVYGSRLGMKFYEGEDAVTLLKRRGNNGRSGTFYGSILCIEPGLSLFLAVKCENKTL